MPTLHIHLDESGNFTFSPKGSKYYVFATAWTYDPEPMARDLTNLRFSLIKNGHDVQAFHATYDKQANRNAVVAILGNHTTWHFAAIVVEKAKVNPAIREPHHFYPQFASMVLRFIFRGRLLPGTSKVIIFTDTLPVAEHRSAVEKAIKKACRADLGNAVPFESFHHKKESNAWIQVADYCSWAVFRKWEGGDPRTYSQLATRLAAPELDVLAKGAISYY